MPVLNYIKVSMERGTKHSQLNITATAWLGCIGHPLYWFIWTYIYPQPYDSALLRFTSAFICATLLFQEKWPNWLKNHLTSYWHFTVFYALPFPFTYLLLKNDFSQVWLLCHLGMIFFVALLLHEMICYFLILLTGTLLGGLLFFIQTKTLSFESLTFEYIPILLFASVASLIFVYTTSKGYSLIETHKNKIKLLKTLSASIAHEVRASTSSAHLAMGFLADGLKNLQILKQESKYEDYEKKLKKLSKIADRSIDGIKRGDMVIRIILNNIQEKETNTKAFKTQSISTVIKKAISEYAFQPGEKEKIKTFLKEDFYVKGDEDLLVFVLFNLLKNSLFYRDTKDISITLKRCSNKNFLYFKDRGPGISPDKLPYIFNDFATFGKRGGTGLGLPFCERIVKEMGGNIKCDSKINEYTEFIFTFPVKL